MLELQRTASSSAGDSASSKRNNEKSIEDERKGLEDFLCFYEDMFMELSKFGRIDELHVCDNLGDHMIGHVYCKFFNEEDASDAMQAMNGRFYDGRMMEVWDAASQLSVRSV